MKRITLFEFEDISWFPGVVREGMMDCLRFMMNALNAYLPAVPVIRDLLLKSGCSSIIDLCSGGGGDIAFISERLPETGIILTDKYPHLGAFQSLKEKSGGRIGYVSQPVDASEVPGALKGLRTIFTAFHHFDEKKGVEVLKDAVERRAPIAVFEGSERSVTGCLAVLLLVPLCCLLVCPFIRPFRLSRLVFTYLIPLIPLCTMWDGIVSFLRLYKPEELLSLAHRCGSGYIWKAGKLRHKLGFRIVYLTGRPV